MAGPAKERERRVAPTGSTTTTQSAMGLDHEMVADKRRPVGDGEKHRQSDSDTACEKTVQKANHVHLHSKASELKPVTTMKSLGSGLGYGLKPGEERLLDDAVPMELTSNEAAAEQVMGQVKNRFLERLEHMTSMEGVIEKDNALQSAVVVRLIGKIPNNCRNLLQVIERAFNHIAQRETDFVKNAQAQQDLRESVFEYYKPQIQAAENHLRNIFSRHKSVFVDIQTQMSGALDHDEKGSDLDRELGDLLTAFQHKVCPGQNTKSICEHAFDMTQLSHLKERLKGVLFLRSTIASDMYLQICTLASPELALVTFTRLANLPNVSLVRFVYANLRPHQRNPSHAQIAMAPKSQGSLERAMAYPHETSKRMKEFEAAAKPVEKPTSNPVEDSIIHQAKQYLSPADQELGLAHLQPESKRQTFLLLIAVLRYQSPNPNWDCYHDYGFVVCASSDESNLLRRLYHAILTDPDCGPKTSIFKKLWEALENNLVPELIKGCDYIDALRADLPELETFLSTPRKKRSTVGRLIQFIHDKDNTNPPLCLVRDYGFQSCKQREEVGRLKRIYEQVLARTSPIEVHGACVQGKLFEFARSKGVVVEEHKRLMQNDGPSPIIGFDNDAGLRSRMGLFWNQRK